MNKQELLSLRSSLRAFKEAREKVEAEIAKTESAEDADERKVVKRLTVRRHRAETTRAFVIGLYKLARGETPRQRCQWVVDQMRQVDLPVGVRPVGLQHVQRLIHDHLDPRHR